jgi:PAS domain S-box-containing protein
VDEGEAQFRDFAELLPECVFEADALGRVKFVNGKAYDLFCLPHGRLVQDFRIEDMVCPEDRALVIENFGRLLAGEDLHGGEYTLLRADGSMFPGLICSRLMVSDRAPVGVRGIIVDMTERRRTMDLIAAQRDLAISLSSATSVVEALGTCLSVALTVTDMQYGAAYLFDRRSHQMSLVQEISGLDCDVGAKLGTQITALFLNLGESRAYYGDASELHPSISGPKGAALLPIRHEGRLVGGIHLLSTRHPFIELWRRRGVEAIVTQVGEVIVRLEAEALIRTRARYSEAVARCGEILVESADVGQAMRRVVQILCEATGVSRVYVFENFEDPERGLCMRQITEAVVPGVKPEIDNALLQDLAYKDIAQDMVVTLAGGKAACGIVRDMPEPDRSILGEQGILSLLHVPIRTHRGTWGFLGFDDCQTERQWTSEVIETLTTVASMVGAAVERRRAEEDVRDRELRYRAIVEGFDGLIYVCSEDNKVEFMNSRLVERTGRLAIGETCYQVLHDLEDGCDFCVNDRVQKGETVRWEVKSPKDGRWYYCVNTPIRHEDGRVSKQAMILDITDRRQAEEEKTRLEAQMQHTQKLESLGVLAGGIAHDFNNLLGSVLGNADLMLLELPPWSPLRARVESIRKAADRAAELTDQMLAYSGRGTLVKSRIDLNTVVMEMAQLLGSSVSKRAELSFEFAEGLPPIEGDGAQLRQIVMNLITNASDALEDRDGVITLRTWRGPWPDVQEPWSDGVAPADGVNLEVSDTGCGMDSSTVGKIFDPFFTTKFTGRGLGLAAVQGIVRSHGGKITLKSSPGNGTSFRIWLPSASVDSLIPMEQDSPSEPPPTWHGEGTILLAEDELSVSDIATSMLDRMGFRVLVARDGSEACSVYERHSSEITVAVIDVTMPKGGGKVVYETIRSHNPALPILIVSGYSETDATKGFAGEESVRFLKKPYSFETLMTRLRAALKKSDE